MLLENIQAVVVLQVARCLASNTHPNVVGSFAERHERRDVEFAGEVTKEIVRPPFKKGGVGFVDRCRTSPVVCWANDSGAASFVARCRPVDKRGRRLPQKLCNREAESCCWTCDVPLGFRLLTAVRPCKTVVDGEPSVPPRMAALLAPSGGRLHLPAQHPPEKRSIWHRFFVDFFKHVFGVLRVWG